MDESQDLMRRGVFMGEEYDQSEHEYGEPKVKEDCLRFTSRKKEG